MRPNGKYAELLQKIARLEADLRDARAEIAPYADKARRVARAERGLCPECGGLNCGCGVSTDGN